MSFALNILYKELTQEENEELNQHFYRNSLLLENEVLKIRFFYIEELQSLKFRRRMK